MELLPLVCLCLLSCSGDAVRVVVEEDSDAVLPCLISTKEDLSGKLFVWKKDGQKEKQVFTHDTSDEFPNRGQDEQFKGRVSVFQDQLQNGDASIKITRTKMADSGTYSCDFPRHHPRQTSIIELVVGAAPEPNIKILDETNHWRLLQCEAHGDPLPTLEWKDSDNNTLPADTPQISDRGGRSYITVKITVTKTGRYRCVATQEKFSHQIAAETYVRLTAVRVVVEEDSDAVLPCLISTEEDISGKLFHWSKDDQKVFLYDAGVHSEGEQFKGRVSFFQDQLKNGDASIKITGTKMADSGNYSCDFPRHQPRQTSIIELVVGLAPEPVIKILAVTKDGVLLQCEARGDPRPTIKWKDSDNKTLPAEEPQISDRGGRFYTTVEINVTKTNNYSCVATQKQFSHQVTAMIPVYIQGAASKPSVRTIQTDDGMILQCEVLGASPKPKVEWKDRSGNILQTEEPQVTESGGRYDIVLRAAVTKTDTFRCVVTQEEISHQIYAETYASVSGAASKPYVTTIKTDKGVMLQCEVLGAFPKPKVEWKDSSGNTLPVKEVNETEKGDLFYIILRADVTKTDTFRCVVNQEEIGHQTEAEIYVVNGAAPKPNIDILKMTKNWILLQCEARGVSPLTVEWKDGAGNILKSESTPKSETGSPSSITLNITVTKTDDYSCVATQKEFSHEIAAVIPVYIQGSNTGAIVGGVFGGAGGICFLVAVIILLICCLCRNKKKSDAVELNPADQNSTREPLKQPDP